MPIRSCSISKTWKREFIIIREIEWIIIIAFFTTQINIHNSMQVSDENEVNTLIGVAIML